MSDTIHRIPVGDLKPGQRFLTPRGNTLTVKKVRPALRGNYGDVEVITLEEYVPGELFQAPRDYLVAVA